MDDTAQPGKLWERLARRIEREIADGVYGPGDRLPPEGELARRFEVNRHTVRRAMAHLAERGRVRIEQGRGTFVHEEPIDYPIGTRTRFSQNIASANRMPGHRIIRAERVRADRTVARALSLRRAAPVAVIETTNEADGRPIARGIHYFPAARLPGIVEAYRETGSLTSAFARIGVTDYRRLWTRITAQVADAETARQLEMSVGRAVLQTENVDVDPAGTPIEYGITQFAGDRLQLVIEADEGGP